jgi:predicted HTH transcriptional regulator
MATSKTFAVAGVSTHKDGTKIRFANDAARVKILVKNGHTDIELIDLPREMTKAEIAQHLKDVGFGKGNAAIEAAIADLAKKNRVKAEAPVNKSTTTVAETEVDQ